MDIKDVEIDPSINVGSVESEDDVLGTIRINCKVGELIEVMQKMAEEVKRFGGTNVHGGFRFKKDKDCFAFSRFMNECDFVQIEYNDIPEEE